MKIFQGRQPWVLLIRISGHFFFFLILRRMGKNKALAHHTYTYFHTRRVSIVIFASCVVCTCNILCAWVLHDGRGHIVLLKKQTHIVYIRVCTYLFIRIFQGRQRWVRLISGQYLPLQAALLVLVIYYMGDFLLGGVLFLVHYNGRLSVGIFTLGGEYIVCVKKMRNVNCEYDRLNGWNSIILSPSQTGFIVSAHRLTNITLLNLIATL